MTLAADRPLHTAPLAYRRDIDGLRAVAVGSVLLFHAGLLGVTGGFVGVDVFFVISGYLITQILQNDVIVGRFSIWNFYDRRIRRILPAYFAVAVITSIATCLLLPPHELADYGRRLASTAAFVSNFFFRAESDYFAPAAADNPLLHTWSLSVEEQFYLIWPLLLFALSRPPLGRWMRPIVAAMFLVSLSIAAYTAATRPVAAFYYSPLRAWELLLGAMIALRFVPRLGRMTNEVLAALGLVLILFAAFFYTKAGTVFPGAAAIPPCLGAALIILAGRHEPTAAGRILSLPPFVFIGLISYSLYMWHWPLLCLLRLYLGHELSMIEAVLALAASIALASLSWWFVERPFRRFPARKLAGLPASIPICASLLVGLLAFGLIANFSDGWPSRASQATRAAQQDIAIPARGPQGCMAEPNARGVPVKSGCLLGAGGERDVGMVLLGDSHAAAYAAAIDQLGRDMHFTARQWTRSSCYPLLVERSESVWARWFSDRSQVNCDVYLHDAVARLVADAGIKSVVIAGFWSSMQDDEDANDARAPAGPEAQTRLHSGLEKLVATLSTAGKTIILLGQVPVFPNGGGECIVRQRFLGRDAGDVCKVPRSYVQALLGPSDDILTALAARYRNVHVYLGSSQFCAPDSCVPLLDGHVTMRDEHHLSVFGSQHLVPGLKPVFRGAGVF